MKEFTLEDIKNLAELVTREKLDFLKFDSLEIKKSFHESKENQSFQPPKEDYLYAAGAEALPPEVINAFIHPRRRSNTEE